MSRIGKRPDSRWAPGFVGLALAAMVASPASAQVQAPAQAQAQAQAPPAVAAGAAPTSIRIPEGTEMLVRFDEGLSSGRNSQGDKFSISLDDSVDLGGGVILPAGFSGRGEVTAAQKKGFMGQAGELNVRLEYIRVGETRIRLRASKGGEGKGAVGATVALTVLFGPLGLLKRGHDIEITPGQTITAFVDQDVTLPLPVPAPPVRK